MTFSGKTLTLRQKGCDVTKISVEFPVFSLLVEDITEIPKGRKMSSGSFKFQNVRMSRADVVIKLTYGGGGGSGKHGVPNGARRLVIGLEGLKDPHIEPANMISVGNEAAVSSLYKVNKTTNRYSRQLSELEGDEDYEEVDSDDSSNTASNSAGFKDGSGIDRCLKEGEEYHVGLAYGGKISMVHDEEGYIIDYMPRLYPADSTFPDREVNGIYAVNCKIFSPVDYLLAACSDGYVKLISVEDKNYQSSADLFSVTGLKSPGLFNFSDKDIGSFNQYPTTSGYERQLPKLRFNVHSLIHYHDNLKKSSRGARDVMAIPYRYSSNPDHFELLIISCGGNTLILSDLNSGSMLGSITLLNPVTKQSQLECVSIKRSATSLFALANCNIKKKSLLFIYSVMDLSNVSPRQTADDLLKLSTVVVFPNLKTCIDVNSSILAAGDSDGCLCVYNHRLFTTLLPLIKYPSPVIDLPLHVLSITSVTIKNDHYILTTGIDMQLCIVNTKQHTPKLSLVPANNSSKLVSVIYYVIIFYLILLTIIALLTPFIEPLSDLWAVPDEYIHSLF